MRPFVDRPRCRSISTRDLPDRRRLLQGTIGAAGGLIFAGRRVGLASWMAPAAGRAKLKITAVKTYLLRHTLQRPFGVSVSVPLDKTREMLLVKVETDAGIVGWGETAPVGGVRGAIDQHLGPMLVGENPLDRRRLWRKMWGPNFGNALAVGAVDMALDDVRGWALEMPVAELYGGRLRDRVPAYASAMNYVEGREPEDYYADEAAALVKQGFRSLKMRLGRYSVAREAAVAAAVREAVGPDIQLAADGNAAYTLASAVRMGRELDRLGFEYFEEPLPQAPKYAGYDELQRKLPLSLAAGEALDSRASAKELIDRRGMDIIQPDVSLCGGIGEVLFIAEMAALAGIRCIPHCWGSAVLIAATTHLVSLLPDPHWGLPTDSPQLEFDQSENPWRTQLVRDPPRIDADGMVRVPTRPGLGVEVDEAVVRKYAVP